MAGNPPAFQLYADDFMGGVCDMTQQEIGAYILLLCYQWNNGAIPTEPKRQKLIAKGGVSARVIEKFTLCPDGQLRNARMEKTRREQDDFRQGRSEAGKIGAQKRWHSHSSAIGSANGKPMATPMANRWQNDSSPVSYLLSPNKEDIYTGETSSESTNPTPSKKHSDHEAEAIYAEYPRKIAKGAAITAIRRALKKHTFDDLLSATRRYAVARAGEDPNFTPYPATWFNREQFMDDPANWSRMQPTSMQTGPTDFSDF